MCLSLGINAQQRNVKKLTKKEILQMSISDLADYDLESLIQMMNIVGASSIDEMYQMILNQSASIASKSNEKIFNSALSTSVVTQKEIKSAGATSIEEALKLIPGVIVREKTQGNFDVQIRGNQNMPMNGRLLDTENSTTLVMVNGRPVFNNSTGCILWETIPVSINEIQRIEVVRGACSALYGPNAVNGAINIITQKPDDTPTLSVNYQGGVPGAHIADISISKKLKNNLSFRIQPYLVSRQRRTDKIYSYEDDAYYGNLKNEDWQSIDVEKAFSNPYKTKEKKGANLYIEKSFKDDVDINLSGGYLNSGAITSTLSDNGTSYASRNSDGYYVNLNSKIHGLNLSASVNNIVQDFNKGVTGWKLDSKQTNATVNYLFKIKSLSIRPEVSYQNGVFDDRDYIDSLGEGLVNDYCSLSNYSGDIRFDYKFLDDKVRLIAALRDEKFSSPDIWKTSWQFAGTYAINDNNIIRIVAAKANKSSTMLNAFANYTYSYTNETLGNVTAYFSKNDNCKLMSMNMFELGYRFRPVKQMLIDVEGFYNKSKDYGSMLPYGVMTNTTTSITSIYVSYLNSKLKSKQYGATINCDLVMSEKLYFNINATWQQTTLDNFYDENTKTLTAYAFSNYYEEMISDIQNGTVKENYSSYEMPGEDAYKNNVKNEAVPAFWGSLEVNYRPLEKLSISAQGYYYDNYYMYTENDDPESITATGQMDGKCTVDAKVNYDINKKVSVFFNGRNILDNDKREFVYMDKIGGVYLLGLNVSL